MNDFEGLLASDYGFKPSNKSAPMASSSVNRPSAPSYDIGSRSAKPSSNSFSGDADSVFASRSHDFDDILGGSARLGAKPGGAGFDFDAMFDSSASKPAVSSEPVFDKPVYDDDGDDLAGEEAGDIFSGVPGVRSSSSKVKYDNVFASASPQKDENSSAFDDLLGGFGKTEPRWKSTGSRRTEKPERSGSDFDDLIPGFRATSPPADRSASEVNRPVDTSATSGKTASKAVDDPFVFTGQFSDPLEEISKLSSNSRNGRSFDDVDPFDGLVKPTASFTSERDIKGKDTSTSRIKSSTIKEPYPKPSVRSPDTQTEMKIPVDNGWDSHQTMFDSHKPVGQNQTTSPPSYASASFVDLNQQTDRSPSSEENVESSDDVWLSVSEIPLFTQPTNDPPPSRPPPPKPVSKVGMNSASANARRKNIENSSFPNPTSRSSVSSPFDELDDFARAKSPESVADESNGISGEELEMNSAAAAMKEAMDRAHAKFRQAKEVREREGTGKAFRNKEGVPERDEKYMQEDRAREKHEKMERQRLQREREEEELEQQRLEEEQEREERERDQRRIERERERAREIEREREKARLAVERATREARERAAIDARQRAERAKAEKAAVEKVTSEARERAERAAVQRAQSEARERAAADAKERAEKAASEARERANAEAKEREARERASTIRAEAEARTRAAERAAVGRAAMEARERAAMDARDRAAAAARASQQKNEDDIESFFNMGRATSAPRPRSNSSDPLFDAQFQSNKEPAVSRPASVNSSNIKKASSATNIVDDLSSIFNAAPKSGGFQDVEGETEDRRRARLERHQRAQERAAKALAEKNERDLQVLRDQAERNRISDTLDVEIKRWAAGKEGNLRALLSTMQYVLWPECGWQPVSLTDMITAASVKKVYRKATLCIHPDKVQQKGANLQQKYVAEKVFDLLKEAWNKFNSEELF